MLKTRVNHQIKAVQVRVISDDGKQIGVMKLGEALALANEHGLDLVEVSPLANPPVCKLIDFAKFRYQQKKLEQQQKKNAKKVELKTIWISMRISEHDMQTKAAKVTEFLKESDVVKIELRMRGREQAFGDQGYKQLQTFLTFISEPYRTEVPPKRMGGTWSVTVAPSK